MVVDGGGRVVSVNIIIIIWYDYLTLGKILNILFCPLRLLQGALSNHPNDKGRILHIIIFSFIF